MSSVRSRLSESRPTSRQAASSLPSGGAKCSGVASSKLNQFHRFAGRAANRSIWGVGGDQNRRAFRPISRPQLTVLRLMVFADEIGSTVSEKIDDDRQRFFESAVLVVVGIAESGMGLPGIARPAVTNYFSRLGPIQPRVALPVAV